MMIDMHALIDAAELARKASGDKRLISIYLTELGFAVSGRSNRGGDRTIAMSGECNWQEMVNNPAVLANCVRLVDQRMSAAETDRAGS